VLAGRDSHGSDSLANARVSDDVVRARWLLDPPRVDLGERADRLDRLLDAPRLVRVERQPVLGADRLADDARALHIAREVAADLELQVRETLGERIARARRQRVLCVAEPAGGGRVRGKAVAQEHRLALGLAGL